MKKEPKFSIQFDLKSTEVFEKLQYIINNMIEDQDVRRFISHGIIYIFKKEIRFLMMMGLGAFLMMVHFLSFLGLCLFLTGLTWIGVKSIKFLLGMDDETFEEIVIELEETSIKQKTLLEFIDAQSLKRRKRRPNTNKMS